MGMEEPHNKLRFYLIYRFYPSREKLHTCIEELLRKIKQKQNKTTGFSPSATLFIIVHLF